MRSNIARDQNAWFRSLNMICGLQILFNASNIIGHDKDVVMNISWRSRSMREIYLFTSVSLGDPSGVGPMCEP